MAKAATAKHDPYRTPLPTAVVTALAKEAEPFRAPQYDQPLQKHFWPHVYNEEPGSGKNVNRLQAITGTNTKPLAVQISGTVVDKQPQPDGDLHISFKPDNPKFPCNIGDPTPLEAEIIYAGRVRQQDALQAQVGFVNPIHALTQVVPGAHIRIAGPLIYDRSHGVERNGHVQYGLEVHPICALTILKA